MTREERFERRLADWLEDGPYDAPNAVIDAVFEHARTHPRRRIGPSRLWKAVKRRVHPAEPVPGEPHAGLIWTFAAVGITAVLAVATVGGIAALLNGNPSGLPVGGTGATPGPTPPSTPTPAPLATPPVWVTASTTCPESAPGSEWRVGDVTHLRGILLTCTNTSSDARLDGVATVDLNLDLREDESADMWGSATIETDGGTWRGYWLGTVDEGYTTHRIEVVYLGSGGYGGLRLRTSQTSDGADGVITGMIETADALPATAVAIVTGSECVTVSPGSTTQVGEITRYSDVVLECGPNVSSDPRLDAEVERVVIDIDRLADGSGTMTGTGTLTNDGGTWSGRWTGTIAAGYTTHRMEGVYTGTANYAGLQFIWSEIGEGPLFVRSGAITPIE